MKSNNPRVWHALVGLLLMGSAGLAQQPPANEVIPLPNADFENGGTDWSLKDSASMSQVMPEAAHTGKTGLRVTDNDEKLGSSAFSARIPATTGQGYKLTFWAKSSSDGAAGVYVWFYNAEKRNIVEYQPVTVLKKSDDWKLYELLVRAPETTASMNIWIHTFSTAKTSIDLDDFQFERSSGPAIAALAVVVPAVAGPPRPRTKPAYIILKLDDLVRAGNRVPAKWVKLADFIEQRKIHTTIGIICNSLEGDNPEYTQWIKDKQATGLFEFWNHGYTHGQWQENGQTIQEFKGASYEKQLENLTRSEALAREKLGFPLVTFGSPFNSNDENTSKALAQVPDIKVWMYGDAKNNAGKVVLDRVGDVNIENPLFVPSLERFIAGYNKYPDRDYFVIQGHAAQWDDARFDQFVKIVDFLTEQKAIFVTPSEYVALKKLTLTAPAITAPAMLAKPAAAQTTVGQAVTALAPLNAPQALVANSDFSAPLQNGWTVAGKTVSETKVVDTKIEGTNLSKALQFDLAAPAGSQPWDVRLVANKTALPIAKNDLLLVQFWARSTPKTRFLAVYQQSSEPFEKTIRQTVSAQPKWQKFTFYAPARTNYAAGGSNFELQLGQATGKVEIAGLSVQNMGPLTVAAARTQFGAESVDYYGGEDHDDSWMPTAEARIEKFRKADFKIRVVDQNGKPVKGAQVALKQTKSAFRWGTAVNYRVLEQSPDGDAYRTQLKRLFNTAVLENELKWKATDNNPEAQARAVAMLNWLNSNGFAVRGHTLVWGSDRYLPGRLQTLSPDALRAEVEKRVTDAVTATKGKVYVWDVVNEAGVNTQLWDKIGWDTFSGVYRLAKQINPNLLTSYNDYNIANEAPDRGTLRLKVEQRIQTLIDAGAPVDILGDQAHIGVPLTPIPRVLEIWNSWGEKYKTPIEVTEFDVNVADDAIHEKYVRDFLIGAFSDPNIHSFLVWGFWEKAHWLGLPGSLFHADWSPRPAELAYEDLVLKKWRTNQTLTSDATGSVQTRGFLGEYEVQVTADGKSKTVPLVLGKDGTKQQVTLN